MDCRKGAYLCAGFLLTALSIGVLPRCSRAATMSFGQARATAMGGAYTAVATGVHAPAWNPANLAFFAAPSTELSLGNLGFFAANDGFSYGDFVGWLDDEVLTTAEIQSALGMFPGGAISIRQTMNVGIPFSVRVKQFAVTGEFMEFVSVGLPRGLFDAIADDRDATTAYNDARTSGIPYSLSGIVGDVWAVGVTKFSYARRVPLRYADAFSVGATLNYYRASPRVRVVESVGEVLVRPNTWQTDARLVVETGGLSVKRTTDAFGDKQTDVEFEAANAWGLGCTLGAAGKLDDKTAISAALHNLPLRSIMWNMAERRTYTLDSGSRIINAKSLIDDKPEGANTLDYLDTLFAAPGSTVERYERINSMKANVPAYLRVGMARSVDLFPAIWTVDFEQGFSRSTLTSTTPRIAAGIEYLPVGPWVPLRAGMSLGGRSGHFASLGMGFHLRWFHWDLALANEGAYTPFEVPFSKRARGLGFASEMKLAF